MELRCARRVQSLGGPRRRRDRGPSTAAFDGLNYIRNSVKVVVDMYDGTVRFYVMDPKDPVLAVYRRAFPGVFKDLSSCPRISRSTCAIRRISSPSRPTSTEPST